jgi:hypothetical protein
MKKAHGPLLTAGRAAALMLMAALATAGNPAPAKALGFRAPRPRQRRDRDEVNILTQVAKQNAAEDKRKRKAAKRLREAT